MVVMDYHDEGFTLKGFGSAVGRHQKALKDKL